MNAKIIASLAFTSMFSLSTLLSPAHAEEQEKALNFGIISTESQQNLKPQWTPFLQDMEKKLGVKVNAFFAPDYAGIIQGMRFNKVDIAWYGNLSAMEAVDRANGQVFAQTVAADGSPGSFQQFLLTHYHMDHVQGLFPLRWGVGDQIPVYGPPDEQGCDDLFKHPGLLDFSHTMEPFVVFDLQGLQVTPLPLNHSKLTFGYLLETAHSRVAWLSDTAGLPEKTLKFLRNNQPQVMVIDCSHPPREDAPRNHCDLNTVLALNQVIRSPRVILTHINHQFDAWLMENALPSGFEAGFDGMEIGVA